MNFGHIFFQAIFVFFENLCRVIVRTFFNTSFYLNINFSIYCVAVLDFQLVYPAESFGHFKISSTAEKGKKT